MKQELYKDKALLGEDMSDEEKDRQTNNETDSQTFQPDLIGTERCQSCHHALTSDVYEGFEVLYCKHEKKYVCTVCHFPELKPYTNNGTSGICCTRLPNTKNQNCRQVFPHSK